jgi:hypothetical protein
MAIALVQQQGNAAGTTTAGGDTLILGATPTSGNMLVCCAENNDDATGPSIATTGVTWTLRGTYFRGDANHDNIIMWTGVVAGGASATTTITFHNAPSSTTWAGILAEFSGVQQVVDGTPPTPTDVSSATPSVTSNTPSVAGDLAVAFCGHTDATAPTATPSGWTALTRRSSTNSLEGAWLDLGGSSSAVTPQWTFALSKFALLEVVLIKATAATALPPLPMVVDSAVARAASW